MPLSEFHPVVARWWAERFGAHGEPTSAQCRGWTAIRSGRDTLIAAPTGSGKTLAAFLHGLDALLREGLENGGLPDQVRIVYVSPLKALSTDIHHNLAEPRRGIRRIAQLMGLPDVRITAAIRTGDTPQAERAKMLRRPPHILVTTPESLFLLLTAERSRELLRTVNTVIVDEIHAVLESRRGAHLALSLERLAHVAAARVQRIGLSATQRPIEYVAGFLAGRPAESPGATSIAAGPSDDAAAADPAVSGHASGDAARGRNVAGRRARGTRFAGAPDPGATDVGVKAAPELGASSAAEAGSNAPRPDVAIVDEGHLRELDIALELPASSLEAVMAGEVWEEVYDRLAQLIREHRTTLVFVNTRRLAERVTRHLADRLGEEVVATHHGSLSKEARHDAETRLKEGRLPALVATASLELGIDIGHVDLVCQLGSPRRIATLLQRVGRSGHTVGGTPRGRVFPLQRDELVECAALLGEIRGGGLDRIVPQEQPFDVLAQQIVAEAAAQDWDEDGLYDLVRRAWPYRDLERAVYDDVVAMLSRGFTTRRARGGALLHRDAVNRRVRGRKAARLTALTAGGAIPEVADYRVILEPEGTFLGTVNEDFAIESMAGDIFQLGNASWLVLRVQGGVVRVADAKGLLPNIPFWLGEAPARTDEVSVAVARLREGVESKLRPTDSGAPADGDADRPSVRPPARGGQDAESPAAGSAAGWEGADNDGSRTARRAAAADWLVRGYGIPPAAAEQIVDYLGETLRLLGALPTQQTLVLERFFDDSGGMQLVLHAPFGSRVNRAWGLALRKKFCRSFNFELQAAATDEAVLLSLGPQHSFPLEEVFQYLRPEMVRETLVQALLDAPVFQTRWRWVANLSLAVPRAAAGRRVPPQLQRMQADDLLAAVFPDAAACIEHVAGEREIPDHPLVRQALGDCLTEAMDLPALERILDALTAGHLRLIARDLPEPSPLASQILNARVFEFLDDAPLEERRTQAVQARRATEPGGAADLGALDEAAIERVRAEAWPTAESADELHDALLGIGFVAQVEADGAGWRPMLEELTAARRAAVVWPAVSDPGDPPRPLWVATERLSELRAVLPDAPAEPADSVAAADALGGEHDRHDALRELLRGRLEALGPVTAAALARPLGLPAEDIAFALAALETEGVAMRGWFSPGLDELEWCDRRLLARIHRYTLDRLRAEIQPVSLADFQRFLLAWQRVHPEYQARGVEGLMSVIEQLDGFQAPAGAWESRILPARVADYSPAYLDQLCLTGRVGWGRRRLDIAPTADGEERRRGPRPLRSTPIALYLRTHAGEWLAPSANGASEPATTVLSTYAQLLLEVLARRGASFHFELVAEAGILETQVETGLAELVAAGLVTADSFAGLRALLVPSDRRPRRWVGTARRRRAQEPGIDAAGRWALLPRPLARPNDAASDSVPASASGPRSHAHALAEVDPANVELWARTLLRRYGVVFRRLLLREGGAPPWRVLARAYRRMEARGEIRGGHFVAGVTGEQFALPDAVGRLRAVRRQGPDGSAIALSAADPLNLDGILTTGRRIPTGTRARVLVQT